MSLDTLSWLFLDHFKDYDSWPWSRFNSFERQLQEHPSFVFAEFGFIFLVGFSFHHAWNTPDPEQARRLKLLWVATFIVGTINDYIFMLLPVVDNFWQAQGVIMLTPRMPLYIPCVYNAFMYWPLVAAARVFHHANKCVVAEACLAGLLSAVFYAPYDVCGARLLWWTWHDSDPGVKLRWLGVPGGSTAWTITFCFSLSLLLRIGHDLRWSQLKSLALACISTPFMIVILNIFTVLGMDSIGQPGPNTLIAAVIVYSACVLIRLLVPSIFQSIGDALGLHMLLQDHRDWAPPINPITNPAVMVGARTRLSRAEPRSATLPVFFYFAALCFAMGAFSPENQISTGAHQEFGKCDVTDVDLLGYPRQRFVCREKYQSWYLSFDCPTAAAGATGRWVHVTPEKSPTWYTVCGRPHEDFKKWMLSVVLLCVTGFAGMSWAYAFVEGDAASTEQLGLRSKAE